MNISSRSQLSAAIGRKTAVSLFFLVAAPFLLTQDAVKVAPKNFKVLQENEQVRVVQDTLAPGEMKLCTLIQPAGTTSPCREQ